MGSNLEKWAARVAMGESPSQASLAVRRGEYADALAAAYASRIVRRLDLHEGERETVEREIAAALQEYRKGLTPDDLRPALRQSIRAARFAHSATCACDECAPFGVSR